MRTRNRILLGVAVAAGLGTAGQAIAQSQLSGPGGIAASPRLRQMLEEHKGESGPFSKRGTEAVTPACGTQAAGAASTARPVAGSKAGGNDNIAASPKLRQLLDERPMRLQIAPVQQ